MTKYKCKHKTNGVIILDNDILSLSAYFDWAYDEGVFEKKLKCWDCWNKTMAEQINIHGGLER